MYKPKDSLIEKNFPVKKLFSSITDLVEVVGLNQVIMWSNRGADRTHPLGERMIVGSKCFHLYEDICNSCHNCPIEELFRSDNVSSCQRLIQSNGEESLQRLVRIYPIFDSKARIAAALKISFDVDMNISEQNQQASHSCIQPEINSQ